MTGGRKIVSNVVISEKRATFVNPLKLIGICFNEIVCL